MEYELSGAGLNFSMSRPDYRIDRPTCMQCWSDKIMCSISSCSDVCSTELSDSSNPDINNCDSSDLHCKCLKCEEDLCGPAFMKCTGANSRSLGIVDYIWRPSPQQCPNGKYFKMPEEALPTVP